MKVFFHRPFDFRSTISTNTRGARRPFRVSISPLSLFASIMPKLPCVVFLERHYKNGGVNEKGFTALSSVIGMISAVGWETHVIFEGKMATGTSKAVMEGHMEHMLQVCKVFKKSMKNGLVKVEYATNGLPDLKDEKGTRLEDDEMDDALTTWGNKLRYSLRCANAKHRK